MHRRHEHENQNWLRDIGGQQREIDPVVRPRDGILRARHREDRQADERQHEREDVIRSYALAEREDRECTERRGNDAEAKTNPAAAENESAQARIIAARGVFGNETLRQIRKAQRRDAADE